MSLIAQPVAATPGKLRGTYERLSSGPASTDATKAGYIYAVRFLFQKVKTPLAMQGESLYWASIGCGGGGIVSGNAAPETFTGSTSPKARNPPDNAIRSRIARFE
jgi:hypothetical protein